MRCVQVVVLDRSFCDYGERSKRSRAWSESVRVRVCREKRARDSFFQQFAVTVGVLVPFAEKGACPSRVPEAGMKTKKKIV